MAPSSNRLSLERIEEASRVIDPAFLNSPQFEVESLSRMMGAQVFVKVETVNPIRSFKGRGADYFAAKLPASVDRLACASAGNFGQGLAYAARKYDIALDVYASVNASQCKLDRIRALGAAVHLAGHDFDAAKAEGRVQASKQGVPFIEDGKEPEISEGAGTIGLELCQLADPFDAVFVPLGNGALIAGVARWMKHGSPGTRIIGVCAAGAPSMEQSWSRGNVVETGTAATIADGIGVRIPIPEAVGDTRALVDHIGIVGDRSIRRSMAMVRDHLGILVEPSGAAGLAALRLYASRFQGRRVAVILTGANPST